jgi:tetraacyldisaccharide 4'-kinase
MRLEEPRFWHAERPGLAPYLLAPAAALYGLVARRRYTRASAYRSRLPVICVGNLTVGGAGKTPLAITIAGMLARLGERPAFLSRGYGGRLAGPHLVDPARDLAGDVGDEPLLLARHAPMVIARDRAAGARAIEASEASVIVMDDGLQNPSLAKDLTLAVIDAERGLGNGRVMPAGPLRAPLDFQLGLANALVLVGGTGKPGAWCERLPALFKGPVMSARTVAAPGVAAGRLRERPHVAYAGIGRPEKLFATAESLGIRLAAREPFPDHHPYSEADAERLLATAARHGAGLLTTEKDLVRLASLEGARGRLREASMALPIRTVPDEADAARLDALLEFAVRARARA